MMNISMIPFLFTLEVKIDSWLAIRAHMERIDVLAKDGIVFV